jgi:protein-disulfide isomerase
MNVPDAISELQKLGVLATPALVVGDKVLVGFDPVSLDEAIAAMKARKS